MKFKAGDRIKIKDTGDWGSDIITIGETGTIIEYSINDKVYRVEFDNYNTWKHDCGGCCRKGHGWNCEEKMLEPAYAIGGYASLHRIPTPEKPVPIEEQLVKDTFKDRLDSAFEAWRKLGGATSIIFENGSSIEALPQKDDTVRGENHFCNGFIGGKISTSGELIVPHREMERAMDRLLKALEKPSVKFGIKKLEQKLKEENNLKFTFYVTEGYRMDKSNNTRIPTMTTEVLINGKDYQYSGSATCDKTDYEEREGVLNAIANAVCGGNFDRGPLSNVLSSSSIPELSFIWPYLITRRAFLYSALSALRSGPSFSWPLFVFVGASVFHISYMRLRSASDTPVISMNCCLV